MLRSGAGKARSIFTVLAGTSLVISGLALPRAVNADTDLNVGGVAVIAYANGDSVRLRDDMSLDGGVIAEYPEGTAVEVIDGPGSSDSDGSLWYRVSVDGQRGYINAEFLANSSGLLSSTSGTAYAIDSLNVRGGPSTADDVVTTIGSGDAVTLTGDSDNGWLSVSANGADGWVYGAFLSQDGGASSGNDSGFSGSGTMYTDDTLNLRSGPSLDRRIRAELPTGTAVYLTGGEDSGFVEVSTDDYGTGWVFATYLTDSQPAASDPEPASEPEQPAATGGQQMVDFAMQFLGQPYVWAGNQPGGFDCSGLTQYVVSNILGIDITHSSELQYGYGTPIDTANLQAGDLVFFANTYAAGITHVGIYIGDGTFIHAENPGTGVVISSLNDSYYSAHYAGARRLT
jgi:cell wall-associated NlpC family hydrolase